jgi:hypothetical protein
MDSEDKTVHVGGRKCTKTAPLLLVKAYVNHSSSIYSHITHIFITLLVTLNIPSHACDFRPAVHAL